MDSYPGKKQIHWNPRPRTRPGLHLNTEKLPFHRPVVAQLQFTASAIMAAERIDVRAISGYEIIGISGAEVEARRRRSVRIRAN